MAQETPKKPITQINQPPAQPKASATKAIKDIDSFKSQATTDLPQVDTNDRKYTRFGLIILLIVFVFGGIWSATAPLNSAAVATGEVVVVSYNKVVQHLEGGLVDAILVDEGDEVKKDQVLMRLTDTQAKSELSMVQSKLNEAYGLEARLIAEQQRQAQINFPDKLTQQLPNAEVAQIIQVQQEIFAARKQALESEIEIYDQRIRALNQQIEGLTDYIKTLNARIESYQNETQDLEALFKEQFVDKMRLQEIQRDNERLKGERYNNQSEVARLKVQIAETRAQKLLTQQTFQQEVVGELSKVQQERIDLSYRSLVLQDRLTRVNITSPDNGIVKGLNVFTVGSVIRPGDTLMEIVPKQEEYGITVRVNPTNINTVHTGLLVDVRFSAFNTQNTHVIEGMVTQISADKFEDKQAGVEYYEARVRITETGLEQMKKDELFLLPGMPVEAMIKTGDRTLFGYFVKPFQDMFARSFKED